MDVTVYGCNGLWMYRFMDVIVMDVTVYGCNGLWT